MSFISLNSEPTGLKKMYHLLREKEGRVYTDEEVFRLPVIAKTHRYYHEWQIRKRSSRRLIQYLAGKHKALAILEAGTGNGWLSHQLSTIPGSEITGIDINTTELQQATRVFSHIPNLQFLYADIQTEAFTDIRFDIIVFAACIQYFPSLDTIISHSMKRLKANGEIHILDSPFYTPEETGPARERTIDYYNHLGFPGMVDYYFHHSISDLQRFNYKTLYQPSFLQQYLSAYKNPFSWICIKKREE